MKLLAFETTTECCSVALLVEGEVRSRSAVAPRRHGELVLPWADELLAECGISRAQLDAVACTRGPGAFTGVRLGISVAQGIALALDLPIVAVSSLRVLIEPWIEAARAAEAGVLGVLDARMGELYAAAWSATALHAASDPDDAPGADALRESLLAPSALDPGAGRWIVCGSGVALARVAMRARFTGVVAEHPDALPQAAHLARIAVRAYARGEAVDAGDVRPVYLRNEVAQTIAQRAAASMPSAITPL